MSRDKSKPLIARLSIPHGPIEAFQAVQQLVEIGLLSIPHGPIEAKAVLLAAAKKALFQFLTVRLKPAI